MKQFPQYFLIFIGLILIFSCEEKSAPESVYTSISKQVEELNKAKISPENKDLLINQWKKLNGNPIVKNDTVLDARTKYNLGKLYAMSGNDSAQFYIERSLEIIDPTEGNLEDKALIYNGMGNIWNAKAKEHQANYYYNKAATILLADSAVALPPASKSIILLSAAQSNNFLFQHDLANEMNQAALDLVSTLPPESSNHHRTLVQIIQTMNAQGKSADSIKIYLDRLEEIHNQNPGNRNVIFFYECKTIYFDRIEKYDSLLHYQMLKSKLDEERYDSESTEQTFVNNFFITNTNLAGTYIALKNENQANFFLQKAEKLMTQHADLITKVNQIIFKNNYASFLELQGKNHEALEVMREVYDLQKLNYQTENTQAVAEMNSLYQLQAKDQSIRNLNENIKINELQLQQNKLWLAISALAAVLLGGVLMFLNYSYRQRRAIQQKEKVILQQQLLRTQMEPHFIFNTLSAVQSFVRLDKKDQAIKYLNSFSRLLRSSLELSRESLVSLEEEIETLENYLGLQQMRFENAFSYEIYQSQEEDFGGVMLPPMLIQPFVENAILHGIDLETNEAKIEIHFQIENDILHVKISDSGKKQEIISNSAHRSLSGTISRERIHLLGKKASIEVSTNREGGTVVALDIPVVF